MEFEENRIWYQSKPNTKHKTLFSFLFSFIFSFHFNCLFQPKTYCIRHKINRTLHSQFREENKKDLLDVEKYIQCTMHMLILYFNAVLPVHKAYAPFSSRNIHTNTLHSTFKSSNGAHELKNYAQFVLQCEYVECWLNGEYVSDCVCMYHVYHYVHSLFLSKFAFISNAIPFVRFSILNCCIV